jgi:hypothetical protein
MVVRPDVLGKLYGQLLNLELLIRVPQQCADHLGLLCSSQRTRARQHVLATTSETTWAGPSASLPPGTCERLSCFHEVLSLHISDLTLLLDCFLSRKRAPTHAVLDVVGAGGAGERENWLGRTAPTFAAASSSVSLAVVACSARSFSYARCVEAGGCQKTYDRQRPRLDAQPQERSASARAHSPLSLSA